MTARTTTRIQLLRFSSTAIHRQHDVTHDNYSNIKNNNTPMGEQSISYENDNVLDVSPLAEQMRMQVRDYTQKHRNVHLVGILASEGDFRQDAELYSERIAETCLQDGIEYELVRCRGSEMSQVENTIRQVNARSDVHGILVFYPIFHYEMRKHQRKTYLNKMNGTYYRTHDDNLRDIVHPSKDVEGLCHDYNARRLFRARAKNRGSSSSNNMSSSSSSLSSNNDSPYIPCTALAVIKILETYHTQLEEKFCTQQQHQSTSSSSSLSSLSWANATVTIINRSEIFGRPLAAVLALNGATVYSVDEDSILQFQQGGRMRRCTGTLDLDTCLERSSVVVTGVPCPDFRLPAERICDGATVVNVSEFCNVHEADFVDRPSVTLITQVGKVTVAALEHNLIRLHQRAEGFPNTL